MTGACIMKPMTRIGKAATAEKRIDLVDAADEPCPRFPAGRKPGTVGLRGTSRLVPRRNLKEGLAPSRDPKVGVRVDAAVMDEMRSPVGDVRGEAGDSLQGVVVPVAG
jgi:hypothetical protein